MVRVTLSLVLFHLAFLVVGVLPRIKDDNELFSLAAEPLNAVLSRTSLRGSSILLFLEGSTSATAASMVLSKIWASSDVAVFEVATDGLDSNVTTQEQLSRLVGEARKLRQLSWSVMVVVVSEEPAFLDAFAQWCLKGRLLVWSTRLLVATRLPLHSLQYLHKLLSTTNSMLVIVDDTREYIRSSVYVHLPYGPPGSEAMLVTTWTPDKGLALSNSLPLFPEKFSKFLQRPNLRAASEMTPNNKMVIVKDAREPGGQRLTFRGPLANLVHYLSKALNFSYTYVLSPDRLWGFKHSDGTWSGMIGMVIREEVDVGFAPFGVTATRAEVVDFTYPMQIQYWAMLGARGRPEVDPWGFLLPLAPLVWAAILTTLLLVAAAMVTLSACLKDFGYRNWRSTTFALTRVFLQQSITVAGKRWWERVVLGLWMMTTLVLVRSYSGNLMSLLAVRYIPEPYQTLRDVLDDPSVAMIWQTDSAHVQYLHSVDSGVFHEVANLEAEGRLVYRRGAEFPKSIGTLVKRGDHVIAIAARGATVHMARDFTRRGHCSLYRSKEQFLPLMVSLVGSRDNPIVPSLSKRIMAVIEAGLFVQWMKMETPNSSVCYRVSSKIAVQSSLSISDTWGMFVILTIGLASSLCLLCLELLSFNVLGYQR